MGEIQNNHGFKFRDWRVYQGARGFRKDMLLLVKGFPKEELYALVDQVRRALNSILLNLAEGSNKNTDKDTRVYINRSQGSLDEVVGCLDCALDDGYITAEQHESALVQAEILAKQLTNFSIYLSRSNNVIFSQRQNTKD
jgi:four helix bundle protein